ncbi:MAG: threonine synthase [Bacteroidota bacterium]
MKLYSTNNQSYVVTLEEAVMNALAPDRGLYMPVEMPSLNEEFLNNIHAHSFQEIAFEISQTLLHDSVPLEELKAIINGAITFDAPVIKLNDQIGILELFHGPSLAFKDFGAQFMSRLMGHFNKDKGQELLILVATSGDTGGAVAAGFLNVPGINVAILYPSGKVSALQEKQLTTLGKNIKAFEIEGTFDDCQRMVKTAFLDAEITDQLNLSSANSINIARLIPQSFYYAEAYKQIKSINKPCCFVVPSGNFGNLTAGLIAKKMGIPIERFIAATNVNNIVPEYLRNGKYNPKTSIATLSNAMDVGNPSNFVRMMELYNYSHEAIIEDVSGAWFDDQTTEAALLELNEKYNYTIDPHGAVGYAAAKEYLKEHPDHFTVILETAHPSKFKPDVERILGNEIDVPERLAKLSHLEKHAVLLKNDYSLFKENILNHYAH